MQILAKCIACAGTGKVWKRMYKSKFHKVVCFHCKGAGKVADQEVSS